MDDNWKNRTELLIGKDAIEKLRNSKVAVYGIGGVGSFVVEGLTRAGIGNLILVDNDVIEISNLNRQIHATHKNIETKNIRYKPRCKCKSFYGTRNRNRRRKSAR